MKLKTLILIATIVLMVVATVTITGCVSPLNNLTIQNPLNNPSHPTLEEWGREICTQNHCNDPATRNVSECEKLTCNMYK